MSRCYCPVLLFPLLWAVGPAQQPNVMTNESTLTATVDRVERNTRVVVFRSQTNPPLSVYVDPKVKIFDDLRPGDVVTVRYVESVIVQVRPDLKPGPLRDSTADARKAGAENVVQQFSAVVTVDSLDPETLMLTYRTHDNRKVARQVRDKRLLEGLHPGDRIEVTQTYERAVSIERGR